MNRLIKLAKILYFNHPMKHHQTCSGVVISLSDKIYTLELAAFFELKKPTKSTYREESGTAKQGP